LESFIVLSQPVADISANTSYLFRFTKTVDNNEAEFLGFELYYKLYGLTQSVENDIGTFDELATHSFRRINDPNKDNSLAYHRPLIDMSDPFDPNRPVEFTITIDFSKDLTSPLTTEAGYPKISPNGAPDPDPITIIDIRRDVPYSSAVPGRQYEFKRFSIDTDTPGVELFPKTDSDLSNEAWTDISTSHQAKISLYVLSYGFDPATSSVLYSRPVWLGSLDTVTFPYP